MKVSPPSNAWWRGLATVCYQLSTAGEDRFFPCDGIESRYFGGKSRCRTLVGDGWYKFRDEIIAQIPHRNVYLSIDKDCLIADEAYTNWEIGGMRVAQIAELIEILSASHDIIGADITGEYSPIQRRNPLFRTIAVADHPHRPPASRQELERNEETNLKLLAGLLR